VLIGTFAGFSNCGATCVGIGAYASYYTAANISVAIGAYAGYCNLQANTLAIGFSAGYCNNTLVNSIVSIGAYAGFCNAGGSNVSIGYGEGYNAQACKNVAIGYLAGQTSQTTTSIILNASGSALNNTTTGFFVNPLRFLASNTGLSTATTAVAYNTATSEIFCSDSLTISTLSVKFGVLSNGVFLTSDSNTKENISSANLEICYSNVKSLPLRRFTYIPSYAESKIDQTQLGFIAQEVYNMFPKSIYSTFDESLSTNILNLNYDQIFISHFGATQLLTSSVEGYSTAVCSMKSIKTEQQSTLQGQGTQLQTLFSSFQSLLRLI
jgi:hypothetical protein